MDSFTSDLTALDLAFLLFAAFGMALAALSAVGLAMLAAVRIAGRALVLLAAAVELACLIGAPLLGAHAARETMDRFGAPGLGPMVAAQAARVVAPMAVALAAANAAGILLVLRLPRRKDG